MQPRWRAAVLIGLAIVASGVFGWKAGIRRDSDLLADSGTLAAQTDATSSGRGLPTLIDLGRDTCEPCRLMVPILRELAAEYRGRVVVRMVDLDEDPSAAARFGVYLIPTQVFLDENGDEVYRHVGYMPKEEIVAILRDMGVD